MKRLFSLLVTAAAAAVTLFAQSAQPAHTEYGVDDLEWFLPVKNVKFNPAVPTPQSAFGFLPGQFYVDWNGVLRYMEMLERTSDRVSIEHFGQTFEHRPFIQVSITSPENLKNLESIRLEHLKITDPAASEGLDLEKMPVVIDLMGSIHGNEASGVNALVIAAYYFAAAEDADVRELLDKSVILITPGENPDGINRFAQWMNFTVSEHPVLDVNSLEYHEPSPTARSNHYWNDCNRDWLNIRFPEGENMVAMYLKWMPNVVLDLHEMGSGAKRALYYFSPGDPNRTHHYVPQRNQDLTREISRSTAAAFDSMGVSFFTERGFDDYFIGKGACYGDIQGSVCLLHEQAAARARIRHTAKWGDNTFAQTIRNQCVASVTLAYRSLELKSQLMEYQRDFYRNSASTAAVDKYRGYVFNARGNRGIEYNFLKTLAGHGIEVYAEAGGKGSYVVPFNQKFYYKAKTIFEDITSFRDSTFYDISTWTMSRAYDLDYAEVTALPALGQRVENPTLTEGAVIGGCSDFGYAFETGEYYAPRMMAALQREGVKITVAKEPFSYKNKGDKVNRKFSEGTIVVAAAEQDMDAATLFGIIENQAKECAVDVYALQPASKLKDFSIAYINRTDVRIPKTALIVGAGAYGGYQKMGEMWYLLDHQYNMNHTLVDYERMTSSHFNFGDYNTIVIYGEMPKVSDSNRKAYKNLKNWLNEGGTLILFERGCNLTSILDLPKITRSKDNDKHVSGVILNTEADLSSPLLWGYDHKNLPVFKMNDCTYTLPEEARAVIRYAQTPYLSGYLPEAKIKQYGGAPFLATMPHGQGQIVFISEDTNFRSFWLATSHLFTNALFFGNKLR